MASRPTLSRTIPKSTHGPAPATSHRRRPRRSRAPRGARRRLGRGRGHPVQLPIARPVGRRGADCGQLPPGVMSPPASARLLRAERRGQTTRPVRSTARRTSAGSRNDPQLQVAWPVTEPLLSTDAAAPGRLPGRDAVYILKKVALCFAAAVHYATLSDRATERMYGKSDYRVDPVTHITAAPSASQASAFFISRRKRDSTG